jgi:transcriptional regulator
MMQRYHQWEPKDLIDVLDRPSLEISELERKSRDTNSQNYASLTYWMRLSSQARVTLSKQSAMACVIHI